jgi:tetratricopeptide (TPR) repeat protein
LGADRFLRNAPMDRRERRTVARPGETSSDPPRGAELLRIGLKHHKAGHLAEAEACYRRVLAAQPDDAGALHLLGLIAHQAGRHGDAVELIRRAVAQNVRNANYFADLGAVLKHQGRLDEAVAVSRRALEIKPDLAAAYCNLGAALREQGKRDEAAAAFRHVVRLRPDFAEGHANLGVLLYDRGETGEAIASLRQALRIAPDAAETWLNLGQALRAQGKRDEAAAACRQAVALKPNHAGAHAGLGALLYEQGKLGEAVAACRQAIRHMPGCAEAYSNLGLALGAQGNLEEAVAAHRQVIRLRPDDAEAYCNLGRALHLQNKTEEAIAALRQAIALNPDLVEAHNSLGVALRALGRLSDARKAAAQAVALAPCNPGYRRLLGEMARCVAEDPNLAAMEALAKESTLSVDDRIELHFALGKAYDDLGRHAQAFDQWLDGNALKRRQVSYDEAAILDGFDRTRKAFTPALVRTRRNVGHPSRLPVFIIGMMRSGTTLIEQILASHPQVFGGGEMKHFASAVKGIRGPSGLPPLLPESVSVMTEGDFRDLGQRYLSEIGRLAPAAGRITDKMPSNFIFAGLIHLALPNAAIIHAVRDPGDTCLSCFSKLFAADQNHTYDLAELGRYYRHYRNLMAHWHDILPPGRILDVRYEDLIADLEGQARRIVAHCGLDWDPHCLAFHDTERPVRTASATQVRQPIYNSSIGRSRPYEPFVGPLRAEIGSGSREFSQA